MPSDRYCCIRGCKSVSRDGNLRFYKFPPGNTSKYEEWINVCWESFDYIKTLKTPLICQRHFEDKYLGARKLYSNAIPSLFLSEEEDQDRDTKNGSNNLQNSEDVNVEAEDIDMEVGRVVRSEANMTDELPSCCNQCYKREKNLAYYRTLTGKLQNQVKVLKNENKKLKRKNRNLENKVKSLQIFKNTVSPIDSFSDDMPNDRKTFCKMQLESGQRYTEEEKMLSQLIFFKSSSVYNFMREKLQFRLPCSRSIYNYLPIKNLTACVLPPELFSKVRESVYRLPNKSKEVVLVFDEIALKRNLTFNEKYDKIEGYVDYACGEDKRNPQIAKNACVFMLRSLHGNWKQILGYAVSEKAIPVKRLYLLIMEILKLCNNLDLRIRVIVCDQSTTNQALYKILGVNKKIPYFLHNKEKVYCLYDTPHLFKSIRNNLMNYPLKTKSGECAKWGVITDLYEKDSRSPIRVCPSLTAQHIYPNRFQKMSVKLAVQVLSASTCAGIRTYAESGYFKDKDCAISTADIIEKFNTLFDCLNSKSPFDKNPYKAALQKGNHVFHYIQSMINFIEDLHFEVPNKKTKINCLNGLLQTLEGILSLSNDIFNEYNDWHYICTNKLNQDIIENLFSHIRYKKRNPSVYEFGCIIARIISLKFAYTSKFANCEEDFENMLDLDWEAILTQTGEKSEQEHNVDECDHEEESNKEISITENDDTVEDMNCSPLIHQEKITVKFLSDNAKRYFAGFVVKKCSGEMN